jgi:hypothetical protein
MGKIVAKKDISTGPRKLYVGNQSNNFIKNIYKLSTLLSYNPTGYEPGTLLKHYDK